MESENATTIHDSAVEEDGDGVNNGCAESDSQCTSSKQKESKLSSELEGLDDQRIDLSGLPEATPENGLVDGSDSDMEIEDLNEVPPSGDSCDGHSVNNPSVLQVNGNFTETDVVAETLNTTVRGEVGLLDVQDEISVGTKKMKGNPVSGVKRPRLMFDEDHPSVCVKYNSLTRSSKLKLEALLRQWSQWHAQHDSSAQDPDEPLESGEETFFPALHIGLEKASSVTFWMDQHTGKQQNNQFIPLDHKSVPLYDRGYALGLTSDDGTSNVERGLVIVDDAARCFNCGSYNHALKECPQPRDNTAVNNARKQLKLKRSQNSGSRNQARYYQSSPAGKYDGLKPGALDAETRKLLGLGELDPPPWLSRMRELGYPPGYLDPDEEDQPSGITIFADGEFKTDQEDGEIVETEKREPERKMSVEFPGINGLIPENADERLWVASAPPSLDISRSRLLRRSSSSHSSEPISIRGHQRDERWSRSEFRDDGPPGVDPGLDPAVSTHLPRYGSGGSHDSHSPRLESFGRFELDRDRRSRFHDEGSFSSSPYSTTRLSPVDYGSSRYRSQVDESRDRRDFDYSTQSRRDRQERYRHLSRW